jgi:hypothetical protein
MAMKKRFAALSLMTATLFCTSYAEAEPAFPAIPGAFHGRWADNPRTCNQIMTVLTYKRDGIYLDEGRAVLLATTWSAKRPRYAVFAFRVEAGGESQRVTEETTLSKDGNRMMVYQRGDPKKMVRTLKRCVR